MRKYENQLVTKEKNVCTLRECDICGTVAKSEIQWFGGLFDVNDTTVSYCKGYDFPEDRDVAVTEFDICPNCFVYKLVPWIIGEKHNLT